MITNPQVGMRVICSNPHFDIASCLGRTGTITRVISDSRFSCRVKFDLSSPDEPSTPMCNDEINLISPEDEKKYQEKLQREQYADQYL